MGNVIGLGLVLVGLFLLLSSGHALGLLTFLGLMQGGSYTGVPGSTEGATGPTEPAQGTTGSTGTIGGPTTGQPVQVLSLGQFNQHQA